MYYSYLTFVYGDDFHMAFDDNATYILYIHYINNTCCISHGVRIFLAEIKK